MDIQEYVQNNFLHLPFFVEALKKKGTHHLYFSSRLIWLKKKKLSTAR